MIVVDSSALIEYYRPGGNPLAREAVAAAIATGEIAVNGIIYVEILAFAREEDRRRLRSHFGGFHLLPLEPATFDLASDLGADLRRRGTTVPATDLIIAASALRAGSPLYHLDSHFVSIAEVSALDARNFGAAA